MRHRKRSVKLGRSPAHLKTMLGSLVCSLIEEQRITTTLPKAREARRLAEKMVTLGKKGTLAARRRAISRLRHKEPVAKLFAEVAPRYKDVSGGYTRIMKTGCRRGDNAEMAILEWVQPAQQPESE